MSEATERTEAGEQPAPIDMILHCPNCGMQHIDAAETHGLGIDETRADAPAEWKNPPHRSHLCCGCGHIWRPADVPTNGVAAIKTKGRQDSPQPSGRTVELLTWHIVPGPKLPDADATVLCQLEADDEDCWPGYYDGERWMSAEGFPFASRVVAWSQPRGVKP